MNGIARSVGVFSRFSPLITINSPNWVMGAPDEGSQHPPLTITRRSKGTHAGFVRVWKVAGTLHDPCFRAPRMHYARCGSGSGTNLVCSMAGVRQERRAAWCGVVLATVHFSFSKLLIVTRGHVVLTTADAPGSTSHNHKVPRASSKNELSNCKRLERPMDSPLVELWSTALHWVPLVV